MFKVKKIDVCPLTGHVDYEIEFSVYGGVSRVTKGTFYSKAQANRKIEEMKRDYVLYTIEKLVNECKQLMELGIIKKYDGRLKAFEKLNEAIHYLQDKDLQKITATIIQIEPFLNYILPPETNERYSFLFSQKQRLVNFSNETINLQKTETCQV